MQDDPENDPFLDLLTREAAQFCDRAASAGPDNADTFYAVGVFYRLATAAYRRFRPDGEPEIDLVAVARTAETYFVRRHRQWYVGRTAQLMMDCLRQATSEEDRKIEFPVFDYESMSETAEEKFEPYGSGYDPLALHKFAQRIIAKGVLRVRGDQDEIYRALLELNEAHFVETSTREEFAASLADMPAEIRDRKLAEFDAAMGALPDQTPETIAKVLREQRAAMIRDYSLAT